MTLYPLFSLLLCLTIHWVSVKKSKKDMLSEMRFRFSLCLTVPTITTSLATTILLERDRFTWSYFFYCLSFSFLLCVLYVEIGRRVMRLLIPQRTVPDPIE